MGFRTVTIFVVNVYNFQHSHFNYCTICALKCLYPPREIVFQGKHSKECNFKNGQIWTNEIYNDTNHQRILQLTKMVRFISPRLEEIVYNRPSIQVKQANALTDCAIAATILNITSLLFIVKLLHCQATKQPNFNLSITKITLTKLNITQRKFL